VKVRDSANKFSKKGPVNLFKQVAILHPEIEKEDSTQENLATNQRNNQNGPGFNLQLSRDQT